MQNKNQDIDHLAARLFERLYLNRGCPIYINSCFQFFKIKVNNYFYFPLKPYFILFLYSSKGLELQGYIPYFKRVYCQSQSKSLSHLCWP